jgi:hypothetical protein
MNYERRNNHSHPALNATGHFIKKKKKRKEQSSHFPEGAKENKKHYKCCVVSL